MSAILSGFFIFFIFIPEFTAFHHSRFLLSQKLKQVLQVLHLWLADEEYPDTIFPFERENISSTSQWI